MSCARPVTATFRRVRSGVSSPLSVRNWTSGWGGDDAAREACPVGVGVVRYRRADLLVRKAGQLRFARRRAAAWDLLRPTVVIETLVGSRAWGLADETSDVDLRGVFVAPFQWTTGLAMAPEDLVSLDGSATFWAGAVRSLFSVAPAEGHAALIAAIYRELVPAGRAPPALHGALARLSDLTQLEAHGVAVDAALASEAVTEARSWVTRLGELSLARKAEN